VGNFWSYVDAYDLADAIALAVESDLPGHEVVYVASPDTIGGHPLAALVHARFGDAIPIPPLPRPDPSAISTAKAWGLVGWRPTRSWRDYLGLDGRPLPPGG